jgi:hypothetical protein
MNIDIVQMGIRSLDGYEYIVDMRDDLTGWIEARMLKTKEAQHVADFVFQDVICRFGCIPQITADNGKEFEGAFSILTRKYGIPIVKSSPYHPEGNGMIERGHRTWITSIWKLCRGKPRKWSQYFWAALWADRVTTRRVTGFSPYYLLYGRPHFFPFHIDDKSWYILDWHSIRTTKELLLMRTKQFAALKEDRTWAARTNKKTRYQAAHDHAKRNAKRLVRGHYRPGTLVIIYQAQFDVNAKFQGAKYRERWAGPYRVVAHLPSGSYRLMELDGSPLNGSIAANRVKLFHSRERKTNTEQIDDLSEEDSLDELDIDQLVPYDEDKDPDYLPINLAQRDLDPNLLTSYRTPEPDWQDLWNKWKIRAALQGNATAHT